VVAPVLEGARPLVVEMQALAVETRAPVPRRTVQGLDGSRVSLLVAVLEQRAGVTRMGEFDVWASVAGGVRVTETAGDLAVAIALAGARLHQSVPADLVALGEVGLAGEVRQVGQTGRRLAEAARLGFSRALVPASAPDVAGIDVVRVDGVRDALLAAGLDLTGAGRP
jgi:DNA repair protein RadA/Sms